MASVRLAIGRADTGDSAGADIDVARGHRVLMLGLSAIANLSSSTNTPAKLVEYAHAAAPINNAATHTTDGRPAPRRVALSGATRIDVAWRVFVGFLDTQSVF